MYNSYVSGNAETLSIDSDDSIWDSDSEEEREKTLVEDIRPGGDRSSQRSYNEHEEHSYFSSVPLTNKDREAPKCRKRTRVSNSDNTSPDEESENGTTSAKRAKTRCRTGDRFMRCIHHVYPGNVVFQNGSSANECVKVSPWQKSDDENSGLAAESSSSAVSSDEFEDDKRVNKKEYCNFRGNQTEEDDILAITHSTDFSRSDTCVESLGASGFSKFPKKYKSAILHRYLSDFTDTRRKARKRPHSQIRGDSPKFESYTDEIEIKISNKRKRRESEATATTTECSEIKRPRLITCDRKNFGEYKSFSTKEREYSELEAAEVLTNLSRSTNIYKHTHTKKSPSESFIN